MTDRGWRISNDWFSLDEFSLYDRIVNVCFFIGTQSGKDGEENAYGNIRKIMIRSDWAPHWNDDGTYEIRKVEYKPDISFKATNFGTQSNIVSVDASLRIRNFFYMDKSGKLSQNYGELNENEKIFMIRIQMGYWGNFQNLFSDRDSIKIEDLESTFDSKYDDLLHKHGITTFTSGQGMFYINTIEIPPNSEISVDFYVGSISPIRQPMPSREYKIELAANDSEEETGSRLAEAYSVLFPSESKSFWSGMDTTGSKYAPTISGTMVTKTIERLKTKEDAARLEYRLENKLDMTSSALLNHINGILTNRNACIITMADTEKPIICVPGDEYDDNFDEIDKQIRKAEEQGFSAFVSEQYNHMIPAYYNMTFTEFCQLKCPFFFWMNPMDIIEVFVPYAITSLIQYYIKSDVSKVRLRVIKSELEFDTIGKSNVMTIQFQNIGSGNQS